MQPALPWFFRASSKGGANLGCVVLFTLPFLMAGLFLLWSMSVRPALDWMRAQNWEPADAVIEKAHLETVHERKKDSHKVVVSFRYHYHGAGHVGTRHSFVDPDNNLGVTGLEELVDRLPLGKTVTCWVNPAAPAEAVLDRSLPGQTLLGVFFSAPFISVGIVGLCLLVLPRLRSLFFKRRQAQLARLVDDGRLPEWVLHPFTAESSAQTNNVALVIATDDRLPQALGVTLLNFFWNGLVGAFTHVDVAHIASGDRSTGVFLSLVLLPFIAVGVGMFWMAIKLWRLTRRPGWVAALRPAPGFEGGEVSFCWAWLESPHQANPPQAQVRIVGQAAEWDAESDSPTSVIGRKRRTKLSDPAAFQKSELELAAVEVPLVDAGREIQLQLPPLPSIGLVMAGKAKWLPVTVWGGWWQLDVTYRDGEIELAELTKAEKFP